LGTLLLRGVRDRLNPDALEQQMQRVTPLMVPDNQRSDIMDVIGFDDLPCTLSWREVADKFDPQQHISYWWSNRSDGFAHATHKHSGPLTAQLFALLFNPAAGAQPGRNGLYPPMFE
jgi:type VI secretion system protein ImpM